MALYGMCSETEKTVKAIVDSMRQASAYGVWPSHQIAEWADRLQLLYDPGLKLLQRGRISPMTTIHTPYLPILSPPQRWIT